METKEKSHLRRCEGYHADYRIAVARLRKSESYPPLDRAYRSAYWNLKNMTHRCALDLIIYCDAVITEARSSAFFAKLGSSGEVEKRVLGKAIALVKQG